MTATLPVSAFIIARDEADRIGRAIDSVIDLVDEVIVVDSGSTDGTPAVAQARGARVVHNDWPGYGPQKRFAEEQCRNDWLLNLDADEAVTPALAEEIRRLFDSQEINRADCWQVAIKDIFAHESAPAPWAYGYIQIRLYDRGKGRFSDSTVHDTVRPEAGARLAMLKGAMEHRSIRSIEFQLEKMNRYSTMQVADLGARGRNLPRWRLLSEFPFAFFKAYVARRYALYGWWGLVIAVNYAYSRFLRVAKAYEADLGRANSGGRPPAKDV
ncbi:glycosyltransferase family 2 protein [Stappia sp. F7233]|uniref:Glycosyltransferase family 2 protein n=1 Tax=Stappia albiluteola TaxID=2758565 RepID=A0A839AF25_9HYPH|nr:glycosyltransferase family 2 protein [Stappia albiluteola]MBA5778303.1 glycosyltransferase family 2 protein [Stappia albiluteola]